MRADFPVVSAGVQRLRDSDRYAILVDELRREQGALAFAVAGGADTAALARHRADIAALQREMARTRER